MRKFSMSGAIFNFFPELAQLINVSSVICFEKAKCFNIEFWLMNSILNFSVLYIKWKNWVPIYFMQNCKKSASEDW